MVWRRQCSPASLLDDIDPAVTSGLVSVSEAVDFQHPLYAHAVVETASALDRLETHRRLSAVEASAEARARHLAHASSGPDPTLADQLDEAAREARQRGGWESSIELLTLAVERTSDPMTAAERAGELADCVTLIRLAAISGPTTIENDRAIAQGQKR